jgi:hypothetical protein
MQNALKHALDLPEVRDILSNKATLTPDFRPAAEMDKLQRQGTGVLGADHQGDRLHAEQ